MKYPAILALILISSFGERVQSLDCPQTSISCVETFTKTVLRSLKENIRKQLEENLENNFDMPEELRPEWEDSLGFVLNDVDFAFQEFKEHAFMGLTQLDKSLKQAAQILDAKWYRWVKSLAVVHTEIEPDVCPSKSSKIIGLPFGLAAGKLIQGMGKHSLEVLNELSKTCFKDAEDGER